MKGLIFAKRNILEYLRNPLSLFFTLVFPIVMFLVFQIIKIGTGATNDTVPMFAPNNLTASIAIFSYSFVALSTSTQIAKDRSTSFQARLSVSPLKPIHFFVGYLIPSLLITLSQTLLCFILGLCFGMSISVGLLCAFLLLLIVSIFYISLGIIVGSLVNEKACGGISSILVNATALLSGMFFPLGEGTFKTVLSCFPFLPSVAIPQAFINWNFYNIVLYLGVFFGYTVIAVILSMLIFKTKLKQK